MSAQWSGVVLINTDSDANWPFSTSYYERQVKRHLLVIFATSRLLAATKEKAWSQRANVQRRRSSVVSRPATTCDPGPCTYHCRCLGNNSCPCGSLTAQLQFHTVISSIQRNCCPQNRACGRPWTATMILLIFTPYLIAGIIRLRTHLPWQCSQ